ncbi:MAG: translocase [Acidobacteria bacterium]|nr:translocase [Acidobacteriota bacterium]
MAASSITVPSGREKGLLERILSALATVEPGEAPRVLLLSTSLFLLLASYYMLKTVREVLILTEGGAEIKSYSAAPQAFLLLLVVPAYSFLASKVNVIRLLNWIILFFISHLVLFFCLASAGIRVGIAFFIWVGIFNVLVIAQFWAFANDIYTEEQGTRLFPIVGLGSSLGAWGGAWLAARLFPIFGSYALILLAAGILLASTFLNFRTIRPEICSSRRQQVPPDVAPPLGKEGGFQLALGNRYLLLIVALILLLNLVTSIGEFLLGKLVTLEAEQAAGAGADAGILKQAFIAKFYGDFFAWVNLLALLFQLFLVSRAFKYLCVCCSLLVMPLIALGGYGLLAAFPLLSTFKIAKVLENSANYSFQNTARHALFLPTSREMKYKAKITIDTFFWRVGDLLQAAVVFLGSRWAFEVYDFAGLNAVFVALWLIVVAAIYYEHKRVSFCHQMLLLGTQGKQFGKQRVAS